LGGKPKCGVRIKPKIFFGVTLIFEKDNPFNGYYWSGIDAGNQCAYSFLKVEAYFGMYR
jgi:hypothetical protein